MKKNSIYIDIKGGKEDKKGFILTMCLTVLNEYYDVKVNGEKLSKLLKAKK